MPGVRHAVPPRLLDALIAFGLGAIGLVSALGARAQHEYVPVAAVPVLIATGLALYPRPEIIFADEPTGNLDSRAGAEVLDLLRRCVREFGQTIVMVTHDPVAASYADRVVFLADGRIAGSLEAPTPQTVHDRMAALDRSSAAGGA